MFGSLFTTVFVQPIFNLLVFIYAIIPGHNFGLAIILFTLVIRYLMYPLLKKQLYHTKKMRELQPLLKKIKKEAAGDKTRESQLTMELYKEKEINPVASLGIVLVQLPLFLALFAGLRKIVADPHAMINFSYSFVRNLPWMKHLATDIKLFDNTLFGVIDLGKSALGNKQGGLYIPALLIVIASSVTQYFQIKQTSPTDKDARTLRKILSQAGSGKVAESSEVNAALGRNMSYVFPVLIFFLTVSFAAALSLYWFVGGLIAYLQQAALLRKDTEELEDMADKPDYEGKNSIQKGAKAQPIEAEIISESPAKPKITPKNPNNKAGGKRKKRKG
jgi:YidC/Oxa1 family membrane protein insertase